MNVETKTCVLFEKRTVAELSDLELIDVNGGSTPGCLALASSEPCAIGLFAAMVYIGNHI